MLYAGRLVSKERDIHDISACEVYHAILVTQNAVGSYSTLSPLPEGGLLSVALAVPACRAFLLGSTLSYAVRTFLFLKSDKARPMFKLNNVKNGCKNTTRGPLNELPWHHIHLLYNPQSRIHYLPDVLAYRALPLAACLCPCRE